MWYFVPTALASSVLPALLRARQHNAAEYARRQQQYYDLSAAVAYALSVPVALVAPWVVRVAYGAEFAAAGPILAVHIWSSVFVFLGVARGQWLVNEGLQKFYLGATCAGAVPRSCLSAATRRTDATSAVCCAARRLRCWRCTRAPLHSTRCPL